MALTAEEFEKIYRELSDTAAKLTELAKKLKQEYIDTELKGGEE